MTHSDSQIFEGIARVWRTTMPGAADSALFDDTTFIQWISCEERLAVEEGVVEGLSVAEIDSLSARIQSSIAASKCKLAVVQGVPSYATPLIPGPASRVVKEANRHGKAPFIDLAVAAGAGRQVWDEEVQRWLQLPPALPEGNYVALRVAGDSMLPLLHHGDVLLVRLGPLVSRNSVVIARLGDDGFVVKRVGRISATSLELKSVNSEFPAIIVPRDPQPIEGTVVSSWCYCPTLPKRQL